MNVTAASRLPAVRKMDFSVGRALRKLAMTSGNISGAAMRQAILMGTADRDGEAAGREFRTIALFVKARRAQLTPKAKKVFEVYAQKARAARAQGRTAFTAEEMRAISRRTAEVVGNNGGNPPKPGKLPAPKASDASLRAWFAKVIAKVAPSGLARVLARPNAFFKRQGFHPKFNNFVRNHPSRANDLSRNSNCGPTSLAMIVKAFGKEKKGLTVQQSIDAVRRAMTGNIEDDDGTNSSEMVRGARRFGLKTQRFLTRDLGKLNAQLEAGRMVVFNGQARGAYTRGMRRTDPSYSLSPINHAICVMGRDDRGRYLVADPMSRRGVARLSRAELAAFTTGWRTSVSVAVWR